MYIIYAWTSKYDVSYWPCAYTLESSYLVKSPPANLNVGSSVRVFDLQMSYNDLTKMTGHQDGNPTSDRQVTRPLLCVSPGWHPSLLTVCPPSGAEPVQDSRAWSLLPGNRWANGTLPPSQLQLRSASSSSANGQHPRYGTRGSLDDIHRKRRIVAITIYNLRCCQWQLLIFSHWNRQCAMPSDSGQAKFIWVNVYCIVLMGLLPDTKHCGLRMRRECRERFPRHCGLAIPTCITTRAWRTCRDACRDR